MHFPLFFAWSLLVVLPLLLSVLAMQTITLLRDPKFKHRILDRTFHVHVRWNNSVAFAGLKVVSFSGHNFSV